MKKWMLVTIVTTLFIVPAMADTFAPPWYVGQPLSYHAEWEFSTPPGISGILPDVERSVGGDNGEFLYDLLPSTHIDFDGEGWGWDPADGDGGIVCPNRPGSFAINTANWVDDQPEKRIRVQITHIGEAPFVVSAEGSYYNPYHGLPTPPYQTHFGPFPADPPVIVDPNHFYQDITIWPNPDWEQIVVDVPMGTIVDEVVVDTISLPEPASISLMLIAGLAVLRRR